MYYILYIFCIHVSCVFYWATLKKSFAEWAIQNKDIQLLLFIIIIIYLYLVDYNYVISVCYDLHTSKYFIPFGEVYEQVLHDGCKLFAKGFHRFRMSLPPKQD